MEQSINNKDKAKCFTLMALVILVVSIAIVASINF